MSTWCPNYSFYRRNCQTPRLIYNNSIRVAPITPIPEPFPYENNWNTLENY